MYCCWSFTLILQENYLYKRLASIQILKLINVCVFAYIQMNIVSTLSRTLSEPWNALPEEAKKITSFNTLIHFIMRWNGVSCKCSMCNYTSFSNIATFIHHLSQEYGDIVWLQWYNSDIPWFVHVYAR